MIVKMAYKLRTDIGKDLRLAQIDGGAGHRHHQGNAGLPPVLAAGHVGGGWGVVSGMLGLQLEAVEGAAD